MPGTEIFEVSSDQRQDLIRWLAPFLPTCIALYRRIQFGHFGPSARLLSSINLAKPFDGRKSDEPWIVVYVDRTVRPETEVWLGASWEHSTGTDDSWLSYADELVKAMVKRISQIEARPQQAGTVSNPEKDTGLPSATNGSMLDDKDQFLRHMQNEQVVLFGSVHRSTFEILKRLGFVDPESLEISSEPYRKYIFDLKNMVSRSLPPGFVYGKVDPKDFALVKSRTQIPRQDRTLRKLPSVAIYPTETSSEPIAWGFLGLDASLTTLHVEPAYRGLGLAKSLSLKLFSEDMNTYCQHDPTFTEKTHVMGSYAHADVAVDNKSSQGVCEGLGGQWYFEVFWIRVDLLA